MKALRDIVKRLRRVGVKETARRNKIDCKVKQYKANRDKASQNPLHRLPESVDLQEKSLAKRWERLKQSLDPDTMAGHLRSVKGFIKKEIPGQYKKVTNKSGRLNYKNARYFVDDAYRLGFFKKKKST